MTNFNLLPKETKFPLGNLALTTMALRTLNPLDVSAALSRHARCDWGDVCEEDAQENDRSLSQGYRLLSAYHDRHGVKFWVITEADRSATTVLLPDDY